MERVEKKLENLATKLGPVECMELPGDHVSREKK
jgi:hypothetical protein